MNPELAEPAGEAPGSLPLPHQVRQKIKDGIFALSLANIYLISAWYIPLYTVWSQHYFKKTPLTGGKLLGLTVNLLCLAALIWLVICAMRRSRSRWFRPVCEWMFLLLLLLPLEFCRQIVFAWPTHVLLGWVKHPVGTVALLGFLACLLFRRRWIVQLAAAGIAILSPMVLMTLARIVYASCGQQEAALYLQAPPPPALSPVREGRARIIWIIFDETDQRLAFDQRPPGVKMPEFDRLRGESVSATNAFPPGPGTIISMPALITGQRVTAAEPRSAIDLELTFADGKRVSWKDAPSIFSAARELGVNTALVGWYHPYDRVLGQSLNYCSWYPLMQVQPVPAVTFGEATVQELECGLWDVRYRHQFIDTCRASLADSLSLVTNSNYGLVCLHLPPPHKPGVFNPTTGRFSVWPVSPVRGYFNNLPLADLFLGTIRKAMERSGQWDRSWVIISSDHHWRWSSYYDGRNDYRVPFIIKAPGGGPAHSYAPAIDTLVTHDLILAILGGDIPSDQQAVPGWLDAHPCAPSSFAPKRPSR
jgi:hypothetical protein